MLVVVVLIVKLAAEHRPHCIGLHGEAGEVDVDGLGLVGHVAHLDIKFTLVDVEHDTLANEVILELIVTISKLHTVAIVVLSAGLAEHLLHVVAAGEERPGVVEINHVGIPVRVMLVGKKRGVGSHHHLVGIALHVHQVDGFGEGITPLVHLTVATVLHGVLTQIHLALLVLVEVTAVLTRIDEHLTGVIVVLVDDGKPNLLSQLPGILIVGIACMRTRSGGTDDDYLGMLLRDFLVHVLEALGKLGRDLLLVADTQILQVEGGRMTGSSTYGTPLGGDVTVGPLNEVEGILYPLIHVSHIYHFLGLPLHAPATVHTLAAHATGQDGHRLHTHVLTELEVLEVTHLHRLVVAPGVLQGLARLHGAYGSLPAVGVPETVTASVYHTSTRETHELGVQALECLGQVLADAMSVVGVLRHEPHHVEVHLALLQHENLQVGIGTVLGGNEHSLILLPLLVIDVEGCLGQHLRLVTGNDQHHADRFCLAADIAHEDAEVVLGTRLDRHAVETVIAQSHTRPAVEVVVVTDALRIDTHIGGVVGMDGLVVAIHDVAGRVARTQETPVGTGSPSVTHHGAVLEGTVLHEVGIQATVGSIADVLEEDTDKFVTDGLAAGRSLHGLLGREPHRGGEQHGSCQECCFFH